jgi:hypothetical protein
VIHSSNGSAKRGSLLLALSLAACGSANQPAAAPATAAASTTPPVASASCLPAELHSRLLEQRPVPPVDIVGMIVVKLRPTCSLEAHDAGGKVTSIHPCSGDNDPKLPDLLNHAVCEVGGEVSWMDGRPSSAAVPVEIHVGRYTKHDETADVALICAPFSTWRDPRTNQPIDPSFDAAARRAVRTEILEVSVTSPMWRLWVERTMHPDQRADALATLLAAAKGNNVLCDTSWVTESPPAP